MALQWLRKGLDSFRPESRGYAPISLGSPDEQISEKNFTEPSRRNLRWLRYLLVLLPSFLQPSGNESSGRRLSKTAWLDGLRGVAAFIVVWHHSSLLYFSWGIHNAWSDWETSHYIQLPIVRLVVAGIPAVCIFFVISGYAISLRLLKLAHLGRSTQFLDALSSSLFRRHPRLFMPAVAVLFGSAIMTWYELFPTEPWSKGVAIATRVPPREETFMAQLYSWGALSRDMANPLRDMVNSRDRNRYDLNLWTLPVEFGCSMIIFSLLAVTYKFRAFVRMAFIASLMLYCLRRAEQNMFLFLAGMFLADIRTYKTVREEAAGQLPVSAPESGAEAEHEMRISAEMPRWARTWTRSFARGTRWAKRASGTRSAKWATRVLSIAGFLSALWLLSMPELGRGADKSPGYVTLTSYIPEVYTEKRRGDYFWVPIGAVLLVLSLDGAPFLQRAFTTRFAQYLGDISFSLYLIHGPLLWSYGAWLAPRLVPLEPVEGEEAVSSSRYGVGVGLCYLCFWPVAIYVSDVVTRGVDAKSVAFARWAYNKLIKAA